MNVRCRLQKSKKYAKICSDTLLAFFKNIVFFLNFFSQLIHIKVLIEFKEF